MTPELAERFADAQDEIADLLREADYAARRAALARRPQMREVGSSSVRRQPGSSSSTAISSRQPS